MHYAYCTLCCKKYSVQCALYNVHFILSSVLYTIYTIPCDTNSAHHVACPPAAHPGELNMALNMILNIIAGGVVMFILYL